MSAKRNNPYRLRRRRLGRRFDPVGIDVLLVTDPANVRYLSGFTGEDSALLAGCGWATLLTDGRFTAQAQSECPDIPRHIRRGPMAEVVAKGLRGRKARRVGLEGHHMTLAMREGLTRHVSGRRLRTTRRLVASLRVCKDDQEIAAIQRAVRIAQRAFRELIAPGARALVGRSEAEVAGELEMRMRRAGAEGASFETIVAAGRHAAWPHYRPGSTRIRPNQAVLIDWGAVKSGYCSDLTRVVYTGKIPPQIGRIHEVVLRAQAAGIAAVRAGKPACRVDGAAREVIEAAGFGQAFSHSLGHGVGLDVHELPVVAASAHDRLRKRQIITIEPGIYLPGVGGVRIEDDVCVTTDGAKVLSSLPKSPQAMTLKPK